MDEFQAVKREMKIQIHDMQKEYAKAIQPIQNAGSAPRKGLFDPTHSRERSLKNLEEGIENLRKFQRRTTVQSGQNQKNLVTIQNESRGIFDMEGIEEEVDHQMLLRKGP